MPTLLLATTNPGKIREYRLLLNNPGYRIVTLDEEGITEAVTEEGNSYEQNAQLKASTYAKLSGLITIADDSGLEVDALNGEPGIYSARFSGKNATDADRVDSLLARLRDIPWERRTAHFKCVIAVVAPNGQAELCYGECDGMIALEPRGENGFGYDPVFYLPALGKTMAELPPEVKNQLSHRARAANRARQVLQRFLASAH